MNNNKVTIDNLTIRLSAGWQGDPVYLARKISEQIQQQAQDLHSSNQLSLSLQGHFSGNPLRVTSQLSDKLSKNKPRSSTRRFT
ncbi:MAG: hypothetical protein IMF15_03640 [Proteobacteria bacterium]|nr:hypothetical protein [Pseudomonadota bacterium]